MSSERYSRELTNLEATSRILLQEKKLKEVMQLYDKCLSARRFDLGDADANTVELILVYAKLLSKQSQKRKHWKAARKLYEEAFDYFADQNDDEYYLKLLRMQHSYSVLLSKLGDYEGAKKILEKLLEKFQAIYAGDGDHDYILNTFNQLGSVLKKIGNLRLSKAYYERAFYGRVVESLLDYVIHILMHSILIIRC